LVKRNINPTKNSVHPKRRSTREVPCAATNTTQCVRKGNSLPYLQTEIKIHLKEVTLNVVDGLLCLYESKNRGNGAKNGGRLLMEYFIYSPSKSKKEASSAGEQLVSHKIYRLEWSAGSLDWSR
jgi:hypothetical protein